MQQKRVDQLVRRIGREDPAWRVVSIEPKSTGRGHKVITLEHRVTGQRLLIESEGDWDKRGEVS